MQQEKKAPPPPPRRSMPSMAPISPSTPPKSLSRQSNRGAQPVRGRGGRGNPNVPRGRAPAPQRGRIRIQSSRPPPPNPRNSTANQNQLPTLSPRTMNLVPPQRPSQPNSTKIMGGAQRASSPRGPMPTMVAMPSVQADIKNARKQASLEAAHRDRQLKQRATLAPQIDTDPPSALHVYVPEHTENCVVEVYSNMTVDVLMDVIIASLADKIELQGAYEGISKEFYGVFIPSMNTWCRPYAKASEYDLYKKGSEGVMAELRLKTKYKEDELELNAQTQTHKKLRKSLANSKIPAYQNNRRQIHIVLSESAMKFTVECDPATSVEDIMQYIVDARPELKNDTDSFEVHVHVRIPEGSITGTDGALTEEVILSRSDCLSACKFGRIQHLEIKRISQRIVIRLESGSTLEQVIHPDRSIQEILLKAQTAAKVSGTQYLFLIPQKGAQLRLENNRSLRSYRMGPMDTLLMANKESNKQNKKLNQEQMIFLKVSAPQFKCDRTLKMKDSATVGEVIYRFSRKANEMVDVALYGLYPSKSIVQLDVKKRLCELNIPNMANMTIKLHGGPPNEIYYEKQVFGVEISKMNLIQADSEQDLKVPDILEELKRALFDTHGLDAEDIFRKKGNKLKEKLIAEELQSESFPEAGDVSQYDPHDIANVILEWFSRLPTPLLVEVDDDDLAMCSIDEEECHYLAEKLREPFRSVFLWMLEMMFEITKNSKVNNMGIKNICACFAPHMLRKPADYMKKAIQDQTMTSVLVAILEGMGSDWGSNIHGGTMKSGFGYSSVGTMEENKFLRHHLL